jgi:hypothetical protein
MDGLDRDVTNLKSLSVLRRLGDSLAVLAANNGELLIVQISQLEVLMSAISLSMETK